MDDPLVPTKVDGCARLGIQAAGALSVIFILVAEILVFVKGGDEASGGWVVVGLGYLGLMATTGLLGRWVTKGDLEESKHYFLFVAQAVGILLLACGFLVAIYLKEAPTFMIGGTAGPVIMEKTGQPRGGPLQLVLNNNQSNVVAIYENPCTGFMFASKISENERYSVRVKGQPSGALCRVMNGEGVALKHLVGGDGVKIVCETAWTIGGVVLFSGPGQWPPGLILVNNPQTMPEQLPIISGTGAWFFPTPVLDSNQYSVTIAVQPPTLQCTVENNVGIATAPVINIQVKCTGVTPPPTPPK